MASVALTNITAVSYNQSKLSISGFAIEHFRIAAGQVSGDTAVLPGSALTREKLIKGVLGPVTNDLPTSGTGATSVTVTLGTFSTAVTSTIGQIDVFLIYFPR